MPTESLRREVPVVAAQTFLCFVASLRVVVPGNATASARDNELLAAHFALV